MRFVITGGGTGGHLVVAKALAEQIKLDGDEAIFIGSTSGQDRAWFEHSELFKHRYFLESRGVVNKKGLTKLKSLMQILKSSLKTRHILKEYKADATISVGGYSAAPACFATLIMRLPLFIHEQNAVCGRLNRLLKPYTRAFYSSYDPTSPVREYPLRAGVLSGVKARTDFKTILFLGGSQGASAINKFALRSAAMLHQRGIKIIHQCGDNEFKKIDLRYKKLGIDVELFGFSSDLISIINRVDMAVSRSGASTLWELVGLAVPTLFVPYPHAASNHQYYNALKLQQQGLAELCTEESLSTKVLEQFLDQDLARISADLLKLDTHNGTPQILASIKESICS